MMAAGLLFNSVQDGGLHLIASATESAGSFGGVLELVLGEADAHYNFVCSSMKPCTCFL